MRRRAAIFTLALVAALAAALAGVRPVAADTSAMQNATTKDAPSVVLIELKVSAFVQDNRDGQTYGATGANSSTPFTDAFLGTGFFIASDGTIATAAHVAAPTDEMVKTGIVTDYIDEQAVETGTCQQGDSNCIAQAENTYMNGYMLASNLTEKQISVTVFTQNMTSTSQGLPATVEASSATDSGTDTAVIKVNLQNTPVLPLADSSSVQVQDATAVIGYPAVADISSNLASELIPTIGSGTITAIKTGPQGFANGVQVFQTDASSGHGDSGGPAINSQGQVIGLVSFGNDQSEKTGYLVTSNEIKDTARRAGANNTPGQIDQLWSTGLSLYDQHHYKAAESNFHNCAVLNPAQVGCTAYDAKATANFANDVPVPSSSTSSSGVPVWVWIVIALVVLAVIVVLVIVLSRRGRGGPPGVVPATAVPVGLPPAPAPAPAPPAPPAVPPPAAPEPPATPPADPPQG